MWSDTLLAAERAHLMRLSIWGAASIIAGTALLAILMMRRARESDSPLLRHFAIQTAAWGAIDLLLALAAWRGLALRDLAGAVRLDRFVWLNVGLDAGYTGVGIALAACGWLLGRRLALVGAGIGVVVQGLGLLVLDLILANTVASAR